MFAALGVTKKRGLDNYLYYLGVPNHKYTINGPQNPILLIKAPIWEFQKTRVAYFGALIIRSLLCRVLYWGPLFSETPIFGS